jgi:hypothetical protein
MTEPGIIFGNNSENVLCDESDFLVSTDYKCYKEKPQFQSDMIVHVCS